MRFIVLTACITVLVARADVRAAAVDDNDAWPLYKRAAARIAEGDRLGKSTPAATNVEYAGYPPFPPEWERAAKEAYEYTAAARSDVRQASRLPGANWPVERVGNDVSLAYLNDLRKIANLLGDAALYEHVHGDDAAAVGRVRDLWRMAELVDGAKDELPMRALFALGVRGVAMSRMQAIASDLHLAEKPKPGDPAVALVDAEALVKRFFTNDADPSPLADKLVARERALDPSAFSKPGAIDRLKTHLRRQQTERNLTAMSLACRLYQFRQKRWPASLDELVALLPARPVDAAGPMGYALVKAGRPDGNDRPLVYSRVDAPPGGKLAYPVSEPQFHYYTDEAHQAPAPGQFRDVTLWAPKPGKPVVQELKPLD